MSDTATKPAPAARPGRRRPLRKIDPAMRKRIEAAIERMIETLDAWDAPGEDLEPEHEGDDDPDAEPSLGATEEICQVLAWKATEAQIHHNLPDGEIDLGTPGCYAPENYSQEWCAARFGARDDREMHEDDEPSLGSVEGAQWFGGDDSDREQDDAPADRFR
jgi:hypothetical protein